MHKDALNSIILITACSAFSIFLKMIGHMASHFEVQETHNKFGLVY